MSTQEEKKNQRIGWGVSIGIHSLLLLFFFLIMAWREPDPPVPEYGIELNFGIDQSGAGDVQPTQPTTTPDEPIEQDSEIQEVESQEETSPPVIQEEQIQEEDNIQDVVETQEQESPDIVEPPETTPEVIEEVSEIIEEEKQDAQVSDITDNEVSEETQGTTDEIIADQQSATQGDDADVEGDKGDPEGTIDTRALYGSQGGGGGPLLELSGWIWDFEPDPKDTSNENGKIVFEIKIDDRGEIISVRTLEKTVSPEIERIYKQEVESLTFSQISSNTMPAPVSTGKITFIIVSK